MANHGARIRRAHRAPRHQQGRGVHRPVPVAREPHRSLGALHRPPAPRRGAEEDERAAIEVPRLAREGLHGVLHQPRGVPRAQRKKMEKKRPAQGPRDDHIDPRRRMREPLTSQMAEPALDPVAGHGLANRLGDNKTQLFAGRRLKRPAQRVHDQGGRYTRTPAVRYDESPPSCSSSRAWATRRRPVQADSGATLAPPGGKDGAAGAGPHPQTKAMGTAATPVARLESTLGHGRTPIFLSGDSDSRRLCGRSEVRALRNSDLLTVRGAAKPVKLDRCARYELAPVQTWSCRLAVESTRRSGRDIRRERLQPGPGLLASRLAYVYRRIRTSRYFQHRARRAVAVAEPLQAPAVCTGVDNDVEHL